MSEEIRTSMTEAKIPERWQKHYEGLTASKDFATLHCDDQIKLIEELGAAEQERDAPKRDLDNMTEAAKFFRKERDALRAEVERLKGDYNVLLDDCIDMRSELAQVRRYDKD